MERMFTAERAISPSGGSVSWVVVGVPDYEVHVQGSAFLAGLRARDCSPNTERTYAGRVALYLSYCAAHGLDWSKPGFADLARLLRWLVDEPLPPRGAGSGGQPRFRTKGTANAVMTAVCEFLRFGAHHG
jgi:integrase/recombinase XerD